MISHATTNIITFANLNAQKYQLPLPPPLPLQPPQVISWVLGNRVDPFV